MSSKANASIAVLKKFKGENSDLDYLLNELRGAAYAAITDLKSECYAKLKAYEEMSDEARQLIGNAGKMRAQAENVSEYLGNQCVKIQQMISTIDRMDGIYSMIDKAISLAKNVDAGLQSAIKAIDEYKSLLLLN